MPNSEVSTVSDMLVSEYAYGSRQKRMENFNALVEFLQKWKKTNPDLNTCQLVAERFCNLNFQYGYVSRNDICQQALMKVNLL